MRSIRIRSLDLPANADERAEISWIVVAFPESGCAIAVPVGKMQDPWMRLRRGKCPPNRSCAYPVVRKMTGISFRKQ